jgi:hypothetical protein
VWVLRSGIEGGGLPQERGELAGDGDRDHAGWLAPLVVQVLPALVQPSLPAPGDLDDARVLPLLARARFWLIAGCLRYCWAASTSSRRASGDPALVIDF